MLVYKQDQIREWIKEIIVSNQKNIDGLLFNCAIKLANNIKKLNTKSLLFLIGPSNNGKIGTLCANQLAQEGFNVEAVVLSETANYHFDERITVHTSVRDAIRITTNFRYIIDCLFGYDLCEKVEYPYNVLIKAINNNRHFVVCCDVPSGINCDNGQILGAAIKGDVTITFQFSKLCQFLYPGSECFGNVKLETIDSSAINVNTKYQCIDFLQAIDMIPRRKTHSHKGTYGRILAIIGSDNMTGAALLSSTTMLKTGAGMLTVFSYKKVVEIIRNNLPEAMTIEIDNNNFERQLTTFDFSRYDLIIIGSGLSRCDNTKLLLKASLSSHLPVIIDGDALFYLRGYMYLLNRNQITVITPHLGEYQRIFAYNQSSIIDDLAAINRKYPNVAIVLKSENTVIAYRENFYFNNFGNDALAKGGSGDVLCGLITSFIAQRTCLESIVSAVFVHSYAAEEYVRSNSSYSMLASDLISYIDMVLRKYNEKEHI